MNDIALSSLRVGADFDASKYKTGADQKIASDRAMVASAQAVGTAIAQTDTKISSAGDTLAKLSRQYLDGYKNQERFEQGLRQIGRQLDSGKTDIEGATRLLVGMNQKLGLTADVSDLAAKGQVQLAAAVGKANAQIEGQAASMAQAAATAAAQAERLETIRQKYDQTYAAGQRMNSELAELAELERSGTQITGGYAGALDTLVLKYDQTAAAANKAASAHKQFIAAARVDQEAENSRQMAAANQGKFNTVLGVQPASSGGARASASVFEADFAQVAEAAARTETLRQRYDQVYASAQRMDAELAELAEAERLGINITGGYAAALDNLALKYDESAQAAAKAATANAAFVATARADQAAENSRQASAANQNSFNSVLGVQTSTSAGARDSASVFEAEFTRLDGIAQLKAVQIGQNFGTDLAASLTNATRKSAQQAASVFEAEMNRIDEIAALKAQQAGGYFQQDFNARMGIGRKVNSAQESASAFANAPGNGGSRLSGFQMQGLGYQANDVVTMALLGAPASQIAFSQGGQILQNLQMGEGGIAGSLSAIKGSAAAAGTALVGTLGTVGLIASGFGIAAVAAGAFYLLTREKTKSLNDALKEEKQGILDLAGAYDLAKVSADNYNKSRGIYAGASARQGQTDLAGAVHSEDIDVLNNLAKFATSGQVRGGRFGSVASGSYQARSQFSDFNGPISAFAKDFDYDALAKGVHDIAAQNPALQVTGDKILNIAKVGHEAAAALKEGADALARINSRAPSLADSQLGQDYRDQSNAALTWLQRQQDAAVAGIGARSPDQLRQAAMTAAAAQPSGTDESADVRQFKIASAGALAYQQAIHSLTEAQDQRKRSLDNTLASAKLDVDLIGKTTAATEGLRMAFQLEQQVREAAAQSNTKVDEAEIARIRAKAAEYGKLKALQEARDTIHGQEIDLETQKAEVATVGENTLARNRAAAALKTEQDIRKLGIPLYGQEANAMRANTAALSDQAAASAKASLQADLLFERSQILRNSVDQQIASAQKSAGMPIDLNSAEANMMRYNMALQETKDTFKGFATDMLSSLEQGKSLWESFGDAAKNALAKIADKLIDRGLDGIFNSLFGGDQAGGGGLLGSLFGGNGSSSQNGQQSSSGGSFLSKLFGGAGGQSVGSMQVQAATVFVNGSPVGGVGGGLSDILSKLGSPDFKADPNAFADILGIGGGAANQNTIQSRIDQAFGTGGSAQDMIQSRIDQAFGTSGGLGGIFSPSGGFASVLGGGGLTGSMSSYASAIKMIESAGSGGYSALGPVLKSGDQALGAYQVMKSNLPSWSTQAFGSPMSKSDFMSNPAAQDAVFEQQFGKLLSKYGNSNDAASAWFTGGPLASGAGKMDVLGTTGSQYVDKFNAALSKLGGVTDHATGSIGNLGSGASSALSGISGAANDATKGLGQFGSALNQFPAAPGGGGGGGGGAGGWLSNLFGSLFGGGGGTGVTPSGSPFDLGGDGLYADGGFTGTGGRNQPAGIVHRGEIVWSQADIQRAGGAHVVEGMRRGYAGYADGGIVRSRMHYDGTSSPRQSTERSPANDRPAQNINQTIVYQLNERPMSPASQNQNAARNAHALERLTRTQ